MKTLICVQDVLEVYKQGIKEIVIDSNTIITPSAKDEAHSKGICLLYEDEQAPKNYTPTSPPISTPISTHKSEGVDKDIIYQALYSLNERGMLKDFMERVFGGKGFDEELTPKGNKLIKGDSIKLDKSFLGESIEGVYSKDVICEQDTKAGILNVKGTSFKQVVECNETNYIIEGSLSVCVDGKEYKAQKGDILHLKPGSVVLRSSMEEAKVYYTRTK